jgi:hypothetical protein
MSEHAGIARLLVFAVSVFVELLAIQTLSGGYN